MQTKKGRQMKAYKKSESEAGQKELWRKGVWVRR